MASDIGPGPLETLVFYAVVLATVASIFVIRRRWSAREAAGAVQIAYWWEAIVHALAVCVVILVGVAYVLGFLNAHSS
jgi:heme/copper-type cytochrome/quinol oxidase subunit 2